VLDILEGMDDLRVCWMKSRVYVALGIKDDSLFENMVDRDGGNMIKELIATLDKPSKKYSPALIFYAMHHDVEEMVEVVEGENLKKE